MVGRVSGNHKANQCVFSVVVAKPRVEGGVKQLLAMARGRHLAGAALVFSGWYNIS
jgi:hypothetical protein